MAYISEESIKQVYNKINVILQNEFSVKILVFDFSHFYPSLSNPEKYDLDIIIYGNEEKAIEYHNLLSDIGKGRYIWPMFKKNERFYFDFISFTDDSVINSNFHENVFLPILSFKQIDVLRNFTIDRLKKGEHIGVSCIVMAIEYAEVQLALYIWLDRPLKHKPNNIIFDLNGLLLGELVFNSIKKHKNLYREKEVLELEKVLLKNKIDSYGHIIFNSLSGNFKDYQKIAKTPDDAPVSTIKENIENIKKRSQMINVMLRILGKKDNETIEVFKERKINHLGTLLDFITNNFILKRTAYIDFKMDVDLSIFDISGKQELIFILLWNLFSNADKHNLNDEEESDESITFKAFIHNDLLYLGFINTCSTEAKKVVIEIFEGTRVVEPRKGMWAIKKCIEDLNWTIGITNNNNQNKIELWINTNSKI